MRGDARRLQGLEDMQESQSETQGASRDGREAQEGNYVPTQGPDQIHRVRHPLHAGGQIVIAKELLILVVDRKRKKAVSVERGHFGKYVVAILARIVAC